MNRFLLKTAFAIILISSNGCAGSALDQPRSCASFIAGMQHAPEEDEISFDIERNYSMERGVFERSYVAMRSINSGCVPEGIELTPPGDITSWEVPPYVDVSSGVRGGVPWVQFVYPSADDEYGPGLSSSIVFYDKQGKAVSAKEVSSYHAWEGTKVTSSRLSGTKLERCTQTIEVFSYLESGDIDDMLDDPIRSPCQYSREDLVD